MANFQFLGITYLVGKIKFKLLFQGPWAKWVNWWKRTFPTFKDLTTHWWRKNPGKTHPPLPELLPMPWWTDRRKSCHPPAWKSLSNKVPSLKLTFSPLKMDLLSQWLTGFKLLGIPYLVGKISRSNFFFRVHWLSEWMVGIRLFPFGMA